MSLILHKDKGVNPHLTTCPRCGSAGDEIVLLGAHDKKVTCQDCGQLHYGETKRSLKHTCKNCGESALVEEAIGDNEKLCGGLCTKCEEELESFQQIVADGGLHFRCKECGRQGVITACKKTQDIRERGLEMGLIKTIDAEMGIEFEKCVEHAVQGENDDKD